MPLFSKLTKSLEPGAALSPRQRCEAEPPKFWKMDHLAKKDAIMMQMLEEIMRNYLAARLCVIQLILNHLGVSKNKRRTQLVFPYSMVSRVPLQVSHINRLVGVTDTDCLVNLRMDRNAFGRLCALFLQLGSLHDKRSIYIEEQVAIFLGVLAHH
ncbi:uncharacterized protein LOC121770135 [Salvia splendens]|uniref:uncharacterized protein LOC121770135 n=1 Tax=Salvia splendens TaxID=180675 RepID=UPI001C263403|nr:uncharacterized protein LOC121770135 [Salvia splendens]